MNKAWLALATLAFIVSAFAAQELEYKGFTIGAAEESVLPHIPYTMCFSDDKIHADKLCPVSNDSCTPTFKHPTLRGAECLAKRAHVLDFGGVEADRIMFGFTAGKLSEIYIRFHPKSFDQAMRSMIGKFGQPTTNSSETVQTGAGAIYENSRLRWELPGGFIRASRYSGKITESSVVYTSMATEQRLKQRLEEQRKTGPSRL